MQEQSLETIRKDAESFVNRNGWQKLTHSVPEEGQIVDTLFSHENCLARCWTTYEKRYGVLGFYPCSGYIHPQDVFGWSCNETSATPSERQVTMVTEEAAARAPRKRGRPPLTPEQRREKENFYARRYYEKHKEELNAKAKAKYHAERKEGTHYQQKNREKIRAYAREYYHRRKADKKKDGA